MGEKSNISKNDYKPLLELIDSVDDRINNYGVELVNSYELV